MNSCLCDYSLLTPVTAGECGMLIPVLLLSRVTGREVLGADGRPVGRLADLIVRVDGDSAPTAVERLAIARRGATALLLPWEEVAEIRDGQLVLATSDLRGFEIASVSDALRDGEILLARDVLDTQVVDVVGHRLARVADVLLNPSGTTGLNVLGVEVGFGGVLRRLGLGAVFPATEDIVAWNDLHLTSERGHAVQLSAERAAVHRVDPSALAAVLSRINTDDAAEILAVKDPASAAAAVQEVYPDLAERTLRALPESTAARILAAMSGERANRWRERLRRRPFGGRRFLRSPVFRRPHLNWRWR